MENHGASFQQSKIQEYALRNPAARRLALGKDVSRANGSLRLTVVLLVTQQKNGQTICNRRWNTLHQTRAELINPNTGKVDTTLSVPHSDNVAYYEEDHLISLEDRGDSMDPRNLWPEPHNTSVGGNHGCSSKGCRRDIHPR